MTDEPEVMVRDLLRARLSDPNSASRVAGTPFIVSRWPYQTNLTTNHFPRISIVKQFENEKPWGIGSSDFWGTYRLQIDVWCKQDQVCTIDATPYEGIELVTKLMRDAEEEIRAHWVVDLAHTQKLIVLVSYNTYTPKIEYDYALWRQTADITFSNIRN